MAARVQAAAEVVERARRLGPLQYSALGPGAGAALPGAEELAAWMAGVLDEIWNSEGRPDPFTCVDVGAGDGRRARELLRLGPECLEALRIVVVEEDAALRDRQVANLSVEEPALILGPFAPSDDPDEGSGPLPGIGPLVTSLTDLPVLAGASVAAVFSFGWLSRQPADRCLWRDGEWWEVLLSVGGPDEQALSEITLPLASDRAAAMEVVASARSDSALYSVPVGATEWMKRALGTAETGWLVAVDRWAATSEPLGADGSGAVALEQLGSIRRPTAGPDPAPGSLQAVRWRLG